jgi:hypothetical protein
LILYLCFYDFVGFFKQSYFEFMIQAYIFADDHSRVILDKVEGDPDSDYINANYIDVGILNVQENVFVIKLYLL